MPRLCGPSPAHRLCRVTSGQVQVDGAAVRGNSTLFQGSVVQAGDATSDLMFPGGSNLLLQPGSTVTVFREYGVLEHGAAVQRGHQALHRGRTEGILPCRRKVLCW